MIRRLVVRNYKSLRDLDFEPQTGMNIIVGDNESGKSTLLEAIALILSGRMNGRRVIEELNPYWFNMSAVDEFFTAIADGTNPEPPSILIEAYFDKTDEPQSLRGRVNSLNLDCPGMRLAIELDPDFQEEFHDYLQKSSLRLLPSEYYMVSWTDFRDRSLARRPPEVGLAMIDGRTARSNSGVDHHTRQMLAETVDRRDSAAISIALRQSRHELTQTALATVNSAIREQTRPVLNEELALQMDQSSAAGWENTVVPQVNGIPFAMSGQGRQVTIKTGLALKTTADRTSFILVEEPENHLSHTALRRLISSIEALADQRQTFLVTHSSYVMNRLGLDRFHLMSEGRVAKFDELNPDTVAYFKKLSGFDTLRVILARRVVIVEGPSDEMLFKRAYKDVTGYFPEDHEIDVITFGTQNRRPLELCHILKRRAAVLRDADKQTPEEWRRRAAAFLKDGEREMFVGDPADGATLEPQIVAANRMSLDELRSIVACPKEEDLSDFLTDSKTEVAWRIASSSERISYPQYFHEAIAFIRP